MRVRRPGTPATLLLFLIASVVSAGRLTAQGVGPLLDRSHWVRPVLQRLDALGALPVGLDPASDGWTRATAAGALEQVGAQHEAAPIAAAALVRLRAELPASERDGREAHGRLITLPHWFGAGWAGSDGGVLASFDTSVSGPSVAAEEVSRRRGVVLGRAGAGLGGWLWAEVVPSLDDRGGLDLRSAHLLATTGSVGAWAGHRQALLGPLAGQPGLVLGDGVAFPAIGAALLEGVVLPGPLALLGPISGNVSVGRLDRVGPTADPWVWLFRGSARPHPRLRIGLQRAALMGGSGGRMDVRHVLLLLVGKHAGEESEVDNQIVTLDAWYRVPAGVPLVLYGSFGADDSAGAWRDVPGWQLGLELAAVPGVPALAVAVERTAFSGSCCGNPPWYRHLRLPWLDGRSPLGHPLGGHGREWRLRGRLDAIGPGVWATADLVSRDRGAENLAAPLRIGRSIGGSLSGSVRRPGGPVEIVSAVGWETGGDWTEWTLHSVLRWWF